MHKNVCFKSGLLIIVLNFYGPSFQMQKKMSALTGRERALDGFIFRMKWWPSVTKSSCIRSEKIRRPLASPWTHIKKKFKNIDFSL